MTDLVLVRHGETVWHADNRYAGVTDVQLTSLGLDQAEQLAGWAAHAGLSAVWTSTLGRAHDTAAPSAAKTGLDLQVDDRLRELDFGEGEGLTAAEMKARFPRARAAFEADPAANPLPGGEDPYVATDRFVAALRDISAAHPSGRVLVVAHTTTIRLTLCRLIGVPLAEYRRLFPYLDNCALTELRMGAGRVAMLQYNCPMGAVR
jgi:broad specificity phosphatase PhoE